MICLQHASTLTSTLCLLTLLYDKLNIPMDPKIAKLNNSFSFLLSLTLEYYLIICFVFYSMLLCLAQYIFWPLLSLSLYSLLLTKTRDKKKKKDWCLCADHIRPTDISLMLIILLLLCFHNFTKCLEYSQGIMCLTDSDFMCSLSDSYLLLNLIN